jgi:hypothetical protein
MLNSGQTGKRVSPTSLYPALHGSPRRIASFGGARTFIPKYKVECGSIADVSSAVVEAVSVGLCARAMGMASSWASELTTPDVCLSLRGLNRIHCVDATRGTVTVEAGVRLGDLTRVLAVHGLSLPSLPFNPNVTVGGAVSTGTHGTSPKWGTLSDFVTSMKIVLASGETKEFGPNSGPGEFRAATVAVGMLGVVVELEFEAIRTPWVRHSEHRMDLSTFLARRNAIFSQYEHVWGHWILGEDKIQIECLETRLEPANGFCPYVMGDNGSWHSLRKRLPDGSVTATVANGKTRQVWMSIQYGVALPQIEMAIQPVPEI